MIILEAGKGKKKVTIALIKKVSPVVALFGKQLLELAQSHHPAFDRCSVRDGLSTEVVSNRHILTHLALARLMPVREKKLS